MNVSVASVAKRAVSFVPPHSRSMTWSISEATMFPSCVKLSSLHVSGSSIFSLCPSVRPSSRYHLIKCFHHSESRALYSCDLMVYAVRFSSPSSGMSQSAHTHRRRSFCYYTQALATQTHATSSSMLRRWSGDIQSRLRAVSTA